MNGSAVTVAFEFAIVPWSIFKGDGGPSGVAADALGGAFGEFKSMRLADASMRFEWRLRFGTLEGGELSSGEGGGECGVESASSNGMCEWKSLDTGELGVLEGEYDVRGPTGVALGDFERRSGELGSRALRKEGRLRKDIDLEEDIGCCVELPRSASRAEIQD